MGKKRDKANEHIQMLVEELVDTKLSHLGVMCPYSKQKVRPCEKYDTDCAWCKEQWGEIEKQRLLQRYVVN